MGTYACFTDMKKVFDWIDRDMLFNKLLEYNIDGQIYTCIKVLYNHPLSRVKLNNYVSDWFSTESGVRQGDSLSQTLLVIFINNLKELNICISFDNDNICILPFVDDIIILAENESQLRKLFDFVNTWCNNWKMKINRDKTKIVRFRKKSVPRTKDELNVEIVDKYKYLGIYVDEFLDFKCTQLVLVDYWLAVSQNSSVLKM